MTINEKLASEFGLKPVYVENIISLLDEGNTIPFIARYRKEMHGSCDDQVLRAFSDRLKYLRNLNEEKEKVQENERAYTKGCCVRLRPFINSPAMNGHGNHPSERDNGPTYRNGRDNRKNKSNKTQSIIS